MYHLSQVVLSCSCSVSLERMGFPTKERQGGTVYMIHITLYTGEGEALDPIFILISLKW